MNDHGFKALALGILLIMGCNVSGKQDANTSLQLHFPKVNLILDPHKMEDAYSMSVVAQLFRGLFRFTPAGDVALDIAKSYQESADHLRYVIQLKNAQFSDGSPILASHVQMSFARMFYLGASMGADLDYISGSKEFRKSGKLADLGVTPISDKEVEFRLSHPSALFLKHLAVTDSSILPLKNYKDELGTGKMALCSGPYMISRNVDDQLEITKWRTDAMDSKIPPSTVIFTMTNESGASLAKAGKTDSLDRDPIHADFKNELLQSGWTAQPTGLAREEFVILNPKLIPEKTRKFMMSRFDSAQMLSELKLKYDPAYGVIPNGIPGTLRPSDNVSFRKSFLSGNLIPSPGKVTIELDDDNAGELKIAQYLKTLWTAPGFEIELKLLAKRERLKRMFGKESQASLGGKGLDYPDGYSVLTYFKGGYDSNYFHVEDHGIDEALSQAVQIFEPGLREEAYRKIQFKILEHTTIVPLFFGSDASGLWSRKVESVPPHPLGYHTLPLETISLKAPK
jgi:ABC-type oligopeptide transport system substrate-binding subunit